MLRPKFHKLARMRKRKQQSLKVSLNTRPGNMGECLGTSGWIKLYDLAGWAYGEGLTDMTLETGIFNCVAPPALGLAEWKKQPMIRIIEGSKDEEYTLGDLIKYVADKEGAHWDFKKHSSLDRIENISNPSNITYPHWVVLCVACYIYTRIHEGMKTNEGAWRQELQQLWMDTGSEDQAVLPDLEYMGMLLAAERNTRGHGSRNMGGNSVQQTSDGSENHRKESGCRSMKGTAW